MSGITRRRALKTLQSGTLVLLLGGNRIAWGASIVAVRIWPSDDYTRITIESDGKLVIARQFMLSNPHRLVVDIESIGLDPKLQELVRKIKSNDPQVMSVRVGQQDKGNLRLVFDLKQQVTPQIFTLKPVAAYKDRLVMDLYPTNPKDPLESLIADYLQDASTAKKQSTQTASADDPLGDFIQEQNNQDDSRASGQKTKGEKSPTGTTQTAGNGQKKTSSKTTDAASAKAKAEAAQVKADNKKEEAIEVANDTRKAKRQQKAAGKKETARSKTPSRRRKKDKSLIIVAIDPGHGGEDPGATGPAGTHEKDVVLQISKRLRDEINRSKVGTRPMRAYMTRDKDYYVTLGKRVKKAMKVQADLFVSIHADAFTRPSAKGASVYALSQSGATSVAAKWIASKENTADLVGGSAITTKDKDVNSTILDMSTTMQIQESLRFGRGVLKEIGRFARLHKPRMEQAGFAVLKSPTIPSILVETAFISNPEEEQKLRDPKYQAKLAKAIAKGIRRYFEKQQKQRAG